MKVSLFFACITLASIGLSKCKPAHFLKHKELFFNIPHGGSSSHSNNSESHFNYDDNSPYGPPKWPGFCNVGKSQSPISFDGVQKYPVHNPNPLRLIGPYSSLPKEVHGVNNGHTAAFTFAYHDQSVPQITGGPLQNDIYNLANFHFHYPCEHLPQKHRTNCKLEVHFVHFNSKYGTLANAADKPDGLAVIGILYKKGSISIASKFPYLPILRHIHNADTEYTETSNLFSYSDALGFAHIPTFSSYKGSLTMPICAETVTWIVLEKPFYISALDLKKFRKIRDSEGNRLERNNRPVQPLNGRQVYVYNQ